jgi:hypothetical protein
MTTEGLMFNFVIALSVFGMSVPTAVQLIPQPQTGDYFEVREIRLEYPNRLYVDRVIKLPVYISYHARVQERVPGGWRTVCEGRDGPILYDPSTVLDQPVTLEWWTNGKCATLPEGQARVITTWTPIGMHPVTVIAEAP